MRSFLSRFNRFLIPSDIRRGSGRVIFSETSCRNGGRYFIIPVSWRIRWIKSLFEAGFSEIEAGTFEDSRLTSPQSSKVIQSISHDVPDNVKIWAFTPNENGCKKAIQSGAKHLICSVSAIQSNSPDQFGKSSSQAHSSVFGPMISLMKESGVESRLDISMAWRGPGNQIVPEDAVLSIVKRARSVGFDFITLCDSWGTASPKQVKSLLEKIGGTEYGKYEDYENECVFPISRLGVHFTDTFGLAAFNSKVASKLGVPYIHGSIFGIGISQEPSQSLNLKTFLKGYSPNRTGIDTEKLADLHESYGQFFLPT